VISFGQKYRTVGLPKPGSWPDSVLYSEPYDSFYFISRFMTWTSLVMLLLLALSVGRAYVSGAVGQSYLAFSVILAVLVAIVGIVFYSLPRNRLSIEQHEGELWWNSGSRKVCKVSDCDVRILRNQVQIDLFPTYMRLNAGAEKIQRSTHAVWIRIENRSGSPRTCLLALESDKVNAEREAESWSNVFGVDKREEVLKSSTAPQRIHFTYRSRDFQNAKLVERDEG
jgi:hypothetical protein